MRHIRLILLFVVFFTSQSLWGQQSIEELFNPKRFSNNIEAARRGNSRAQYEIAQCYEDGIGVEKDIKKAFYWYWRAADQDNSAALNGLGCCYLEGKGVPIDYITAAFLFKRAAEKGSVAGKLNYKEAKKRLENSMMTY